MIVSYRTRQFSKRLWRVILALVLAAIVLVLCWALWLRRFIVYTSDGVRLDFDLSQEFPQGQTAPGNKPVSNPDIYFTEPQPSKPPVVEENKNFSGYYVTVEELLNQLDSVLDQILALPADTPVLVDVKGYWGYFYYTSAVGESSSSFDMATMDAFFAAVRESGVHVIARLPAFRDYDLVDKNYACGVKKVGGGHYVDAGRCYWADPAMEKVQDHLVQITRELRDLGFDEVAFTDFAIPDAADVAYTGDREAALQSAMDTLLAACSRDDFVISFITTDPSFALPDGNCRLYLQDVAAADVQTVLASMDPSVVERTVFFSNSNDTRFDVCGVIRPLKMAE